MADMETLLLESRQLLVRLEQVYGDMALLQSHPETVIQYDLNAFEARTQRDQVEAKLKQRRRRKQRQ